MNAMKVMTKHFIFFHSGIIVTRTLMALLCPVVCVLLDSQTLECLRTCIFTGYLTWGIIFFLSAAALCSSPRGTHLFHSGMSHTLLLLPLQSFLCPSPSLVCVCVSGHSWSSALDITHHAPQDFTSISTAANFDYSAFCLLFVDCALDLQWT